MKEATKSILAWHFISTDCRLRYGDSRLVTPGSVVSVADPSKLNTCTYGMHASVDVLDALEYAPGPVLCRVELSGTIIKDTDKLCAESRRVVWMADPKKADFAMRKFARRCALDVAHLWEMPDVVRRYLETGGEEIRDAAWAAARDAAWDAAWAAARAAAGDVAGDAAWAAARAAARDVAGDAAWAAAWAAARAAAGDVAGDAAWAAARAAAKRKQRLRLISIMSAIRMEKS